MKKKHIVLTATTLSLALALGACGSYAGAATGVAARSATEANAEHREGEVVNTADATVITANGSDVTVTGNGAVAGNGVVTIQKAGTYVLRGNIAEGQLLVDAEEGAEIKLVFNGFTISNSSNAPLVFAGGTSVRIVLKDGTENTVSDLRNSAEENKAAIYTKSDLIISGNGTLAVQGRAEDAIHSETNVTVESGTLNLKAGDDGIHADKTLTIQNGTVNVTESEEGLEGLVVDIQGGIITVTSNDDGINASGGSSSGEKAPGEVTEGAAVNIGGGMVTVKAKGDGIDSNGDLTISGGTVVIDGPSDGGNAPIDYDGKGVITGGTVFASGDSGMFQSLNDGSSTQCSIVYYLSSTQAAGTKVIVADSKGNVIYENTNTTQDFNALLFSAADLKQGESYTVTVGSESQTVSIDDITNSIGENAGNHGAADGMPENRPENGGDRGGKSDSQQRSGKRGKQQRGSRPEGRPEQGGAQDSRQNGERPEGMERPEGRSEDRGQKPSGGMRPNGMRSPEDVGQRNDEQENQQKNNQQDERNQNKKQRGDKRKSDQQKNGEKKRDKKNGEQNTCTCGKDCSCRKSE